MLPTIILAAFVFNILVSRKLIIQDLQKRSVFTTCNDTTLTLCFYNTCVTPPKRKQTISSDKMLWTGWKWCLSFLKMIPTFPGVSIRYTSLKPDRTSSWKIGEKTPQKGKCQFEPTIDFQGRTCCQFHVFFGVDWSWVPPFFLGPGANPEFCTRIHRGGLETVGSGWMASAMWTNNYLEVHSLNNSFIRDFWILLGVLRVSSWWKWSPSTAVLSR